MADEGDAGVQGEVQGDARVQGEVQGDAGVQREVHGDAGVQREVQGVALEEVLSPLNPRKGSRLAEDQGVALEEGKRTRMIEAYRKRIEDTKKQLQTTKGGDASEKLFRQGGVDESKPVTPGVAPPLPPTRPKGEGSRRPSFTSPAPPPARSVDVASASHEDASSSPSVPPLSKSSPRSSFRRSSVVRATSPAPRGVGVVTPSPVVPKVVADGGGGKETTMARAETPKAALVPEVSPRTKAKELIGQTLENLRKRAMPFASKAQGASAASLTASSSGKEKAEEVVGRKEGRQGRTVELQSTGKASRIVVERDQAGAGRRNSGGGTNNRVTRLLQDASLIYKKVDALVERDQNIKSFQNQQKRGKGKGAPEVPNTLFADRLYQSITKLKDLERSRNKMAICAESMESSVKSLHRFADQIDAEKEREQKQEEEKRQAAESIMRTNGSLLQTEITMLLRSYAVEKNQIDQVKQSIRDFLELCVKQL